MASFHATPLPAIDDHLVEDESRYELYDGELVYVPPALDPHGTLHAQISALVEAHAAPEFRVACDLLTRVTATSEIAPDVAVGPRAKDPTTGGRQLEHLAFEVASTESLGHVARKAIMLTRRGVRRVFAIHVEKERALEWSVSLGSWTPLDADGFIEDPALAAPLPVAALIRIANSDDAVARALLIKRNAVLEEAIEQRTIAARADGLAEGKQLGLAEGTRARAEALLVILAARGIPLDPAARAKILGERDPDQLDRWIARAATCAALADVLASH